ncbi:sulfurtransferase [Corynebacterium testudinoris]|uniref:Sulfurtransferase n=1 Tax=Corynebacterium testudinoris TaxID=136857 RepID=A0A0G3H856_9CORY|nr:sulfurtransferase [Corynebacterium testudinoris]AKK08018.1 rhodanese-related sulfurtransferase [Corynebacterium testudinoris]MBX8995638.1 sulfurtransferase [Corynebacterium testudinoris]
MATPFDPYPQFQEYAHPERLVSAAWLSARLGSPGLRVVESDEDTLLYDIGHLPGAVRIDWRNDLNDPVTRDFIDGEAFARLMSEKGIGRDDTVVIYGDQANWWASYTLWVFELFGHPDVRLLDGGRDAWMAEERDTSFMVPDYPSTDYPVVERDDVSSRALVEEVRGAIDTDVLIDVRSPEEFAGTADASSAPTLRRGHIPTARNFPWDTTVHPNSRFRSYEELMEIYADLTGEDPTILYCHLGDRSAHTWFVLKYLLGFTNVRNYDGSWSEWGNMVRMPIALGE